MTLLRTLTRIALLLTMLAILAGFLGFLHPAFDTAAHFRLQLALGLLALGILSLASGVGRLHSAAAAAVGLFAFASCWPGLPLPQTGDPGFAGSRYRMLHFNLRFDNRQPETFLAMVATHEPDLILVQEVSDIWKTALSGQADTYPYIFHCPEWQDEGGTLILSRLPIAASPRICAEYGSLGAVSIVFGDVPVTVANVHLRWPWPASGPRQILELGPMLATIGANALIAGDFNATTWSHSVASFARHGGLSIHPGIGPTWLELGLPRSLVRYIGFPIDNVMSKGKVDILSARALAPAGSDHLPILVEFGVDDTDCCPKAD